MPLLQPYRGFTIKKSGGQWNHYYQIWKDKVVYSNLCLNSDNVAKKCIDTWYRRCGGEKIEVLEVRIKISKEPELAETPTISREIYLSEHEKYIEKLLAE